MPFSLLTVKSPQPAPQKNWMGVFILSFLLFLLFAPCHANNVTDADQKTKDALIQEITALKNRKVVLKHHQKNMIMMVHDLKNDLMLSENATCAPLTGAPPEYDAYGIASKGFVVLAIGAGIIGPGFKMRNDFMQYRSGLVPVPLLEFGWSGLSLGGSLLFLGQVGLDQEDRGTGMYWDIAPSTFNALTQIIVLVNLSIYYCQWRVKK